MGSMTESQRQRLSNMLIALKSGDLSFSRATAQASTFTASSSRASSRALHVQCAAFAPF